MRGWQFWIDRGGTFTDLIGLSPRQHLHVRKVLSATHGADPALVAIRAILDAEAGDGGKRVEVLKVGTTVGTNALLERKGEPVLLVTTVGFGDALVIGDQTRPDIFARHIVRPAPLHREVLEAQERIDADGRTVLALDPAALRSELERARERGLRAVAIVFLHGWRYPRHEQLAAAVAREVGFEEVAVSHELSPLVRYVQRAQTTVLNAYLGPVVSRYVARLERELTELDPHAGLELMQSHGGLATPARFHPATSLLSGPAGGLIGMARAAARIGLTRLIGFDMGGTSTDVSLLDGELPRRFEHDIGGVRVQTAMLDVHTIAAGGGSILRFADARFSVGPESAGSDPGPACYGWGGPLTLTDVQVLLGRLRADTLPQLFGAARRGPIDVAAVAARFAELGAQLERATGQRLPAESLAESFLAVAVAAMANAIRRVAVQQGLDSADFTLFCFGGAAGQHACRVARAAGMRRIVVHPLASVLSAFGIGLANRAALRRASLRVPLDATGLASAATRLEELEAEAIAELQVRGETPPSVATARLLELRAGDSEATLTVALAPLAEIVAAFAAAHRVRFGFEPAGLEVVIEALRIEARTPGIDPGSLQIAPAAGPAGLPARARAWFGDWQDVPLVAASALGSGIEGPALLVEPHSTFVLEPGWHAQVLPTGEILIEERVARDAREVSGPAGPARVEILNGLFMHIAEQMGEVLRRTAQSVNIKERLDFSCALFDARGRLVANAPHMPVHLGSMGASVRAVIDAHAGELAAGDAWLLNSPYHGGTHLPDMTVVSPVHLSEAATPAFFVASRAHHADIGGTTPGSMPPFSERIEEEGALFEDFRLVERGRLREPALRAALASGPYPARNPDQNLADLRAQLAANARGTAELERAVRQHGLEALEEGMREVQQNAALSVRNAIARLKPGAFRAEMDGGQVIVVRIDIDHAAQRARIDFSGTSAQGAHNFNAPRAVCVAAVLYVFRTLVERPIPLNEGCMEPLEIVIPRGCMLDPVAPAAVAAGNVETSQCIVDALYGALGIMAAAQGTMNNLTFGDARLQYYETIAGGSGAGEDFAGCDAVQTHMTNSRLTDPEILEARFPVLLRAFCIRRGSGGPGRYRGGDGVIRRLEFRAPLSGALLAGRRRIAPFGLAGGAAAAAGAGYLIRASGERESLPATARFDLQCGDELVIETPGGGGYGPTP
jgi:5-oxoprolinase (ATP-hydrolysing)